MRGYGFFSRNGGIESIKSCPPSAVVLLRRTGRSCLKKEKVIMAPFRGFPHTTSFTGGADYLSIVL
jgi:hypothetical protein